MRWSVSREVEKMNEIPDLAISAEFRILPYQPKRSLQSSPKPDSLTSRTWSPTPTPVRMQATMQCCRSGRSRRRSRADGSDRPNPRPQRGRADRPGRLDLARPRRVTSMIGRTSAPRPPARTTSGPPNTSWACLFSAITWKKHFQNLAVHRRSLNNRSGSASVGTKVRAFDKVDAQVSKWIDQAQLAA
jgi:hypothetical protein